jgi:ABC-type uncharacterized transport system substrate-binding protein
MKAGRDYEMKISNAQGDLATLSSMVAAARGGSADLVLLTSTPTLQAAVKQIRDIPVLFTFVANPILAGAGRSPTDHLPNVTGVNTSSDYEGMARILRECLPRARRVGTLYVSSEDNSIYNRDSMAAALKRYGIELDSVAIAGSAEVADAALSLASRDIDAICQVLANVIETSFAGVTQAAVRSRLPLFAFTSTQARTGGAAVTLARDWEHAGRDLARLAVRVMRGADPARIPFQPVGKTVLVVNPANARACGFSIPESILRRADEIVGQ